MVQRLSTTKKLFYIMKLYKSIAMKHFILNYDELFVQLILPGFDNNLFIIFSKIQQK